MEDIAKLDGRTLIIRLQLQKPVPSKSSGKTLVIASTHGVVTTTATYDGKPIVVVANAFVYPTKKTSLRPRRIASKDRKKSLPVGIQNGSRIGEV